MNESHSPPAVSTLQVVDSAQKVLGLLVGLASVSYLIGWRYTNNYWRAFHASWVLDLISPTQMVADVINLISVMGIGVYLSLFGPLWDARLSTVSRWFQILLALASITWVVTLLPGSVIIGSTARMFYVVGPFLLMLGGGIGVGICVRWLRKPNTTWNDWFGIAFIFLYFVIVNTAPTMFANAQAAIDLHPETSTLDVVSWRDRPEGDWRLGRVVDKGFVVIKLTSDPNVSEVRLLPYDVAILIRPINRPVM
jgi:hypothetical protein